MLNPASWLLTFWAGFAPGTLHDEETVLTCFARALRDQFLPFGQIEMIAWLQPIVPSSWMRLIGMIPSERSSGRRQRLGKLSKEGNALVRYLWCEAAMHAVRRDPELKRFYRRKLIQKGLGKARAAAARKLGIRLWIMGRLTHGPYSGLANTQ